jgi:hypothetical protein
LLSIVTYLSSLAPIGAVIIFLFAVIKYYRAEAWKRTEYVAKLYKEFSDDASCQTAMCILEGDERKLYYESAVDGKPYKFNIDVLCEALSSKLERPSEAQLHIRDSLDQFFVYIEQFERAIKNKLVKQADVYPYFGYWIGLLKNDGTIKKKMSRSARRAVVLHMFRGEFDDAEDFFFRRNWHERFSLKRWISRRKWVRKLIAKCTAPVARRGEGLQPARQALGADDGVHLPGAVHRHLLPGHRPGIEPHVVSSVLSRPAIAEQGGGRGASRTDPPAATTKHRVRRPPSTTRRKMP